MLPPCRCGVDGAAPCPAACPLALSRRPGHGTDPLQTLNLAGKSLSGYQRTQPDLRIFRRRCTGERKVCAVVREFFVRAQQPCFGCVALLRAVSCFPVAFLTTCSCVYTSLLLLTPCML